MYVIASLYPKCNIFPYILKYIFWNEAKDQWPVIPQIIK